MQHWQSPSDAVVKCKWDKLHFNAHTKLMASAVCIVYSVLARRQALITSQKKGGRKVWTRNISGWIFGWVRLTTGSSGLTSPPISSGSARGLILNHQQVQANSHFKKKKKRNTHQALSSTDLSQSLQQRGASCTVMSECTLLLLCYANAGIMCALYWPRWLKWPISLRTGDSVWSFYLLRSVAVISSYFVKWKD